jgi:hypothetical protein
MNETPNDPGSTSVMPSVSPETTPVGAPSAPPKRKGFPVWAIVLVALVLALGAGAGVYFYRQSANNAEQARLAALEKTRLDLEARLADLQAQVASSTVAATATIPATTTTTPTTKPKPAPKVTYVKELALVKNVTWSSAHGYQVVADYVQMLTGHAAAAAATAAGQESPPPNDYFILNSSSKLRTLSLPNGTTVYVLQWAGAGATTKTKIAVGQYMDIMPGGVSTQEPWKSAYYWLTVKNGTTITKIEQQYLP